MVDSLRDVQATAGRVAILRYVGVFGRSNGQMAQGVIHQSSGETPWTLQGSLGSHLLVAMRYEVVYGAVMRTVIDVHSR